MIVGAPDIKTQSSNMIEAQTTLSISQLVLFNTTKRRRSSETACTSLYHSVDREPPLPAYLGLMTHAKTRKRTLIDQLFNLGLCISYDRVLEISTEMGNNVCARYEMEGVVCPPNLKRNVFTTAAVDNIDHNPTSTTFKGAFHGTGISLFQQPSENAERDERDQDIRASSTERTTRLSPLPNAYTNVNPTILPRKEPEVPTKQGPFVHSCLHMPAAYETEFKWLDNVRRELEHDIASDKLSLSWAAFHASRLAADRTTHLDVSSLLPLFPEEAHSEAMIRHSIDVVSQAVRFIDPNQVPVLACDQPLYAIAKKIQWNWPDKYGEQKLVIMFGGFHTELTALKAIGNWLDGCGWTNA